MTASAHAEHSGSPDMPGATPRRHRYLQAAVGLHRYLMATHWTGQALMGPDPGIRLNFRVGRFIKSYLDRLSWNDDVYFLQAQGYWVLANWALFNQIHEDGYREVAIRCSAHVLAQQREDGAWNYPLRSWAGRIATVEGIWAALGLLETYRQTGASAFLAGAVRWHQFLSDQIGYLQIDHDALAVNYFAGRGHEAVPNNSTDALRFLAEMAHVTRDDRYAQPCAGLIRFLRRAQKDTGEFPYIFKKDADSRERPHFQCYQYNAFQCVGLMSYYERSGDRSVLPIIGKLLTFLRRGIADDGHAHYRCGNGRRTVTYHTAVLGAVFSRAARIGLPGHEEAAERACGYVLSLQEPNGRLLHSQRDYRVLTDRRSYPRYLAMILCHLLSHSLNIEDETGWDPAARGPVPPIQPHGD
jgi:hypothetical protein